MAEYFENPLTGALTDANGMPPPAAPPAPSGMVRRTVGDAGVALLKGAVSIPEAAVGILDIPTMGYAGKAAEALGMKFKETQHTLDDLYSTQHKAAQQEVSEAKGFLPTLAAALKNPGWVADTAVESIPAMLAGGVAGRAAVGGAAAFEGLAAKEALKLGAKAAAIGEGGITAGQTAEGIRQQTEDGTLSVGQSAAAVGAGAVTGAIGFGAGKFANKLGITDMDVLAASGLTGRATGAGAATGMKAAEAGLARRVAGGVVSEGLLEEMPQSMQEQMWNNVALGKPVTEGVAEAGAQGLVVGGAMGGTVAGKMHNNRVADAVAGMQVLMTPPTQNPDGTYDTSAHEDALKATAAWVGHNYPERKAEANAWRLAQIEALSKGGTVSYDGMPEFAPESAMSQLAQLTIDHLKQKEAGRLAQEAVVDAFGQLQQSAVPGIDGKPLTKQEQLLRTQLESAIANNDYEAMTRLQGKLGIRQAPPEAPPETAAPEAAPDAEHTPVQVAPGGAAIDDITLRAEMNHIGNEIGADKYAAGSINSIISRLKKSAPDAKTVDEQVAAAKELRAKLSPKSTQQAKILDAFIARMEGQLGVAAPVAAAPSMQGSAKATGVKTQPMNAAMKKVAGMAGANATVEQQAQAARSIANDLSAAGQSEAQVKVLNHFADSVLGAAGAPAKVDLKSMTQDQHAEHLKQNGLPDGVGAYDALTARPELRHMTNKERLAHVVANSALTKKFTQTAEAAWSALKNNPIAGIVAHTAGAGWHHFTINTDSKTDANGERHKAYVTLKDFNNISSADLTGFAHRLQAAGYNGQLKFPEMGSRALLGFDNIVMHGATEADVKLAEQVAREHFKGKVESTKFGKDGKGTSHTDLIANEVEAHIKGAKNGQATDVNQGASSGPANTKGNAPSAEVPKGNDAAQPAQAAAKESTTGTGEPVRQEVADGLVTSTDLLTNIDAVAEGVAAARPKKTRNKKPSKSEQAAQADEEAKAKHDEALAKAKALQEKQAADKAAAEAQAAKDKETQALHQQLADAEKLVAELKAKKAANKPMTKAEQKELDKQIAEANEVAAAIIANSPNIGAQETLAGQLAAEVTPQPKGTGAAPKPKTASKADEAATTLTELTPAQKLEAQQSWDEARNKDAELGGVDARGWHTPLWADLSTEAQAHWAALAPEARLEKAFNEASQIDHQIRAVEKSKEVGSEAKRVVTNANKEASREANAHDLLRRAMKLRDSSSADPDHAAQSLQLRKDYLTHMKGVLAEDVAAEAENISVADIITAMIDETGAIAPAKLSGKVNKSIREALLNDPSIESILDAVAEASGGATIGASGPVGRLAGAIATMAKLANITIKYSPTTPDNPNVALRDTGKKDAEGRPILVQRLGVARMKPNGVEIEIFSGGENAHTIVHEVVHALTAKAIKQASEDMKNGKTTNATVAMQNLDVIAREVQRALGEDGVKEFRVAFQHLGNAVAGATGANYRGIAEFVAEVMSNSALQKAMKGMISMANPTSATGVQGTLFDRFVAEVRRILKLGTNHFEALYKAIDASVMLMAEQEKMGKAAGTATFEQLATPQAALNSTKAAVGKAVSAASALTNKLMGKQELGVKAEKLALYLSSTLHIARTVAADKVLRPMKTSLDKWFDADRAKTNVIQLVTGFMYPHVRATEVALLRTGKYVKYNTMMNNVAAEMSNLSILLDGKLDFNKSFADNKLTNPKMDAQYKERFDAARAEYLALKQQQPALLKIVEQGFVSQRKAFVMYTAANLVSTLQQHRLSSQSTSAAAEAILAKYAKALDVGNTKMVDPRHTNSDSTKFSDARTSEIDAAIRGALAMADRFGGDAMHDQLLSLSKKYDEAVATPYHHMARPGNYFVSFSMSDTSRASIDEMNKVLEPYGVVIGGFKGAGSRVTMKLDKLDEVSALTAALRAHRLVATEKGTTDKDVSSGLADGSDRNTNAFQASQAVNKLRAVIQERINAKRTARGATSAADKKAIAEMEGMVNDALVDMLEVDSARTALAMRKGAPGYAADYVRSYAKRAEYHVSLISNAYARPMFAEAFKDMKTQIGALHKAGDPAAATKGQLVYDELAKRHDNAMNPVDAPVIDALRAFGHNFYLALSPAYIAVNLMQPYQLTMPLLGARHGFVKTFQAMKDASTTGFKILSASIKQGVHAGEDSKLGKFVGALDAELKLDGVGLSANEQEFIRAMIRSGAVDLTQAHEIGRLAESGDRRLAIAAKTMGVAGHYSEVLNRLTAGIAAYRLAKSNPKMSGMSEEDIHKYAIEVVDQTQLRYSDHNTARAIGRHGLVGKVTPLAAAFQNYAFQVTEHYVRLVKDGFTDRLGSEEEKKISRNALFGTLGATSVLAGVMGLPFATVLAAVANGAGGDDKEDSRSQFRRWLATVFGDDTAEIIAKGAPRAIGADMSSRAGQADMLPGSRFLADRRALKDKMKDGSMGLMGPAVNGGLDIVAGAMAMADGDVGKGFEAMMPLAIRGYVKAAALANKGAFENKAGNALAMPVTPWDIAVQATGFNPSKKAEQSEANFYYQAEQNLIKQDKAKLVGKAVKAYEAGDMEAFQEAQNAVYQYSILHPNDPITGLNEKLMSRAKGRALSAYSGTGIIDTNAKHLPSISKYQWAQTGIERTGNN